MTINRGQAVGRMIVGRMVVLDFLPRHVRDFRRFAALIEAHVAVGESGLQGIVACRAGQGGSALHLRIHRTGDGQGSIRAFQRIAPCFGLEDAFILVDHRVEAAVQIEICVLEQLRFRQRCHRIARHHLIGHGVHVGVVRLVGQVEEQALRGILLRAVQRRMLKNMRNALVIVQRRDKGNVKHAVSVLVQDEIHQRTGLLMLQQNRICVEQRQNAVFLYFKAVDDCANCQHRAVLGQRHRRDAQQHRHAQHQRKHGAEKPFFHLVFLLDLLSTPNRVVHLSS